MAVFSLTSSLRSNKETMMKTAVTPGMSVAGWEKDFKGNDKQM